MLERNHIRMLEMKVVRMLGTDESHGRSRGRWQRAARACEDWTSITELAARVNDDPSRTWPTPSEREAARRAFRVLEARGLVEVERRRIPGTRGGPGHGGGGHELHVRRT